MPEAYQRRGGLIDSGVLQSYIAAKGRSGAGIGISNAIAEGAEGYVRGKQIKANMDESTERIALAKSADKRAESAEARAERESIQRGDIIDEELGWRREDRPLEHEQKSLAVESLRSGLERDKGDYDRRIKEFDAKMEEIEYRKGLRPEEREAMKLEIRTSKLAYTMQFMKLQGMTMEMMGKMEANEVPVLTMASSPEEVAQYMVETDRFKSPDARAKVDGYLFGWQEKVGNQVVIDENGKQMTPWQQALQIASGKRDVQFATNEQIRRAGLSEAQRLVEDYQAEYMKGKFMGLKKEREIRDALAVAQRLAPKIEELRKIEGQTTLFDRWVRKNLTSILPGRLGTKGPAPVFGAEKVEDWKKTLIDNLDIQEYSATELRKRLEDTLATQFKIIDEGQHEMMNASYPIDPSASGLPDVASAARQPPPPPSGDDAYKIPWQAYNRGGDTVVWNPDVGKYVPIDMLSSADKKKVKGSEASSGGVWSALKTLDRATSFVR